MSVVSFPLRPAGRIPAQPAPADGHADGHADGDDPGAPTVTIGWVARQLGVAHYGTTRLTTYLTAMVAEEGFPPPLPRAKKGGGLVRFVTMDSCWRREAVECWLFDFLPDPAADALDRAARSGAAEDMDAAAARLGTRKQGAH